MRIQLLKRVGKWPVTTVMTVTNEKANEWLSSGTAREYKGVYPPKQKHKMNLSQLKA